MIKKVTLHVDGMVCSNCEKRIEEALLTLNGIEKIKANFKKSIIEIHYNEGEIDQSIFSTTIDQLGYKVLSKPIDSSKNVIPLLILLFAAYYMIKNTIGFNFIPEVSDEMGYGLIFIVGILTSIHCVAMCGGIALSQSLGNQSKERSFVPSIQYNLGRVISYTVIGGLVGGLGAILTPTGQFKGIIAVGAGIFMFLLGLKMLNIFTLPNWLSLRLPRFFSGKKNANPLIIGFLNGLMPCGPLQTMQLYALGTGSILKGALSMFFFSIGTVPLMFIFGTITSLISGKLGKSMMKASAVLVMVLGILMMNRGLALSGNNFDLGVPKDTIGKNVEIKMEDGKQVINLTVGSNSYVPDIPVVKVGIPVRINLDVQSINGCNNPLTIPEYGIEKDLNSLDKIIEFTPTKEGPITISCWMGMITTNLVAAEELEKIEEQPIGSPDQRNLWNRGCCTAN